MNLPQQPDSLGRVSTYEYIRVLKHPDMESAITLPEAVQEQQMQAKLNEIFSRYFCPKKSYH